MVFGSLAFLALIALCFVLGHWFSRAGHRRWAISSRVAGMAGLPAAGPMAADISKSVGTARCHRAVLEKLLRLKPG
jgi:hypothetical protein